MNAMPGDESVKRLSRRKFLGYAGGIAGAGMLISSCKKDDDDIITDTSAIDLGSNDKGLTNLMFVSQQVEADFYAAVMATPFSGMDGREKELIEDIYNHEIAQREYLRNYLQGDGTVVTTDFSSVTFSNRANVLSNAELIENLVVALFNEIGRLYAFSDNAALVAKLASVEARHAATISNMATKGSFFGSVEANGSEPGMLPSNAVIALNKFLVTKVAGNNLPNK